MLCRVFGIEGFPGERAVEERLWALAESLLPPHGKDIGVYIQAQMDLGATVCTRSRPACERCPLTDECAARRTNRVAALPVPRPRKIPPRRAATMAVVVYDGRVLLERRPPAGIWGGLLALPEIPAGMEANLWAAHNFALGGARIEARALPPLTHTFTHFVLDIAAWRIDLPQAPRALNAPVWQWLPPARLADAALPAPVRKILADVVG